MNVDPGQFTQLGSPRKQVVETAIRDLEYHDELLSLLQLPEQQNRDAVMIIHMGGMFESKEATLQRFRENYATLSQSIKNRIVLENCDMGWSVHDLLPVCEELNIPMVLDFHHHNIVFNADEIREGTKDIIDLFPRIKATWDRKGIKQKMHYSEPTPPAVTKTQRRKHNPRPFTLPPCAPDMDLMIEAKDKEQAVFELMKNFKLPGYDSFTDIVPYTRNDDNKAALAAMNKKKRNDDEPEPILVPEDEIGMGGPEGRVYWPPGMEEWLRPKKREVKKKEPGTKSKEQVKKEATAAYEARKKAIKEEEDESEEHESDIDATPATKKAKAAMRKKLKADAEKAAIKAAEKAEKTAAKAAKGESKKKTPVKKAPVAVPTPSDSESLADDLDSDSDEDISGEVEDESEPITPVPKRRAVAGRRGAGRSVKGKVSYNEDDD
jgi:UV DNA damage endonuclease